MAHLPDLASVKFWRILLKTRGKVRKRAIFIAFLSEEGQSFMLATCFATDFLNGQHLVGHPINSHLTCAWPLIVPQPTEIVLSHLIFKKLIELSFRS